MDHLWCALKANILANYQFKNIDEHADFAEHWVLSQQKRSVAQGRCIFKELLVASFCKINFVYSLSQELLGENGELIIEHAGQEHCLRKTRQNQNKLTLTK